ncbi:unnamed protein product, partial [Ixodes hexagonus]
VGLGYRWPDPNCGESLVRLQDKHIVGGRPAKEGEFPWQVFARARGKLLICGGSLILPDVVLTAAHCLTE